MKKEYIMPVLIMISFSFVSASQIPEVFQDNVTQLTITINQTSSQADLFLNTTETSFDNQSIDYNGYFLNIKVSDVLNSLNGQIEIEEGNNTPHFNSLLISSGIINLTCSGSSFCDGLLIGKSFSSLLTEVFNISGIPLKGNDTKETFNKYLFDNSLPISSDRHIIFIKNGNSYSIWDNKGYSDISSSTLEKINDTIIKDFSWINVNDVVNEFLPLVQNNTQQNLSFIKNLDLNYTVGFVNLSQVKLEDGEYNVTVFVERDGQTYYKTVKLILSGINSITSIIIKPVVYNSGSSSSGGSYHSSSNTVQAQNITENFIKEQLKESQPIIAAPKENDIPIKKLNNYLIYFMLLSLVIISAVVIYFIKHKKESVITK